VLAALEREWDNSAGTFRAEGAAGAARFAKGAGRHGCMHRKSARIHRVRQLKKGMNSYDKAERRSQCPPAPKYTWVKVQQLNASRNYTKVCDKRGQPVGYEALRFRSRNRSFLHKGDAKHIRADQQRETTNGKGEIDLIHGDLSETALFEGTLGTPCQ
jgi:hypothetical protein